MEQVKAVDFARGEVAIFDALAHVIFVHRLTKILQVIRVERSVEVGFFGVLGNLNLARSRGEADLHGLGVSGEDLRPLPPGGTVTLVYDDVAEVVRWVEGSEKVCRPVF